MIVHKAEKNQIKYFTQKLAMCKLLPDFPAAAINYVGSSFGILQKTFHHLGNCRVLKSIPL